MTASARARFRHLFVVTYGRTGSTLLMGCLNSLPGFCIRGENAGVLPILRRAFAAAASAHSRPGDDSATTDPWYSFNDVDVSVFAADVARLVIECFVRPDPGAVTVGFKDVRFYDISPDEFDVVVAFMCEQFERAGVIILKRDLDDVLRSAEAVGWSRPMRGSRRRAFATIRAASCSTTLDWWATRRRWRGSAGFSARPSTPKRSTRRWRSATPTSGGGGQ